MYVTLKVIVYRLWVVNIIDKWKWTRWHFFNLDKLATQKKHIYKQEITE